MTNPILSVEVAVELTAGTRVRQRVFGTKGLLTGLVLLGVIVAVAALAPLLAPHDPYTQDLTRRLIPPPRVVAAAPDSA